MSRLVGLQAPDFTATAVVDQEFKEVTLSSYRGKYVVLFFYPLDFTFVCPTEIVAFDDAHAKFQAAGAEIVGCSVDSVHTHLAYTRTPRNQAGVGELNFPLLSDLGGRIASSYDVLFGDKSLRGVFIIDPDGVVQSATVNFLPIGRNVDEVFRTLRAAQYVRESGNVCPANWQDGDAGMAESLDGVKSTIG